MSTGLLCRLCLEETDNFIGIFTDVGMQLRVVDIISQHLCFHIKENDDISSRICMMCWTKLFDFHNFYMNVIKAQDTITIIESKFTLDDKSSLKEIIIGDTILKVNEELEFDDDDGENIVNDDVLTDIEIGIIEKVVTRNIEESRQNDITNERLAAEFINETNIDDENDKQQISTNILKDDFLNVNPESNEIVEELKQSSFISQQNKISSTLIDDLDQNLKLNKHLSSLDIHRTSSKEKIDSEEEDDDENYLSNDIDVDQSGVSEEEEEEEEYVPKKRGKQIRSLSVTIPRHRQQNIGNNTNNNNKNKEAINFANKESENKIIESYYKMSCEICHENFRNFDVLFEHYTRSHGVRGFITCCGKKYFKRSVIAEHVLWHLQPDLFKCKDCNKLYADKRCLNNHLLTHAPPDMKLYKCDHCPKSFVKKFKLDRHKLCHLSPEEKKYLCDECNKPYASEALLRAHKRVVHDKTYAHMCEICARVFKSRVFFEKHQLEHLGQNLPPIQCKICESWMKNEHTMRAHMRLHQDAGTVHECEICGKQGPSRNAILKHKRFVHLSERKFKCTLCDKAFKRAITLKEHMSVHTGEILYTCTFCSKTFNSGANMHSHRKKVHPIEWEEEKRHKVESMKLINNCYLKNLTS